MLSKFGKLFTERHASESVMFWLSVRAWIAMACVATVCHMSIAGIEVKEPLYSLVLLVTGYYFGRNSTTKSPQPQPPPP